MWNRQLWPPELAEQLPEPERSMRRRPTFEDQVTNLKLPFHEV
jgi:hypothetical protein